jgi:hypothetical protein
LSKAQIQARKSGPQIQARCEDPRRKPKIKPEDGLCLTADAPKPRGFATIMLTPYLTGPVPDAVLDAVPDAVLNAVSDTVSNA